MSYQICTSCVMDTTDPNIKFNKDGVCDYCLNAKKLFKYKAFNKPNIENLIKKIKKNKAANQKYDCLIGVSGGLDSSFLVHFVVTKMKLKPLLLHVDAGWNSNLSSSNIEKLVDKLNLDLVTKVVEWEEVKDLQLSFFKAQLPNLDTVQDHAFFGSIYNYAKKENIKNILTGANFSTEFIREPLAWAYHASDLKHIRHVHEQFGTIKLKNFPFCNIFKYKILYRYFYGIRVFNPLNFIDYKKNLSEKILKNEYDWTSYKEKHYESRFTKFFEGFWAKKKFNFDKRRVHLSNLVISNQISRNQALNELSKDSIEGDELRNEIKFICDKLEISEEFFNELLSGKNKSFKDYKSNFFIINILTKILIFFGIEKRLIR